MLLSLLLEMREGAIGGRRGGGERSCRGGEEGERGRT